jgi:hypothetical protein
VAGACSCGAGDTSTAAELDDDASAPAAGAEVCADSLAATGEAATGAAAAACIGLAARDCIGFTIGAAGAAVGRPPE